QIIRWYFPEINCLAFKESLTDKALSYLHTFTYKFLPLICIAGTKFEEAFPIFTFFQDEKPSYFGIQVFHKPGDEDVTKRLQVILVFLNYRSKVRKTFSHPHADLIFLFHFLHLLAHLDEFSGNILAVSFAIAVVHSFPPHVVIPLRHLLNKFRCLAKVGKQPRP